MNKSTLNLSYSAKPSKALFLSFVFLHALAIISLVFISVPIWIKCLVILLIVVMAFIVIRHYAFIASDDSIKHLNCIANNKCRIELNNGKVYQTKVVSAAWLFNYFVVIMLQSNSKKFKLTIAKDALSQEQFYALRLYLRSLNNQR